jgi:glutathione S-transferase
MLAVMESETIAHIPFSPPFLRHEKIIVGQTANVLLYLGGRIGLAPKDEAGRLWTHQLQLGITDLAAESYNSHHPIDEDKWFRQQKRAAIARAKVFRETRLPKFLEWYERVLVQNPASSEHLVGETITYADLSLFQVVDALLYAFPKTTPRVLGSLPHVKALHAAVAKRPRIKAYLESDQRRPYGDTDVFRCYAELDE